MLFIQAFVNLPLHNICVNNIQGELQMKDQDTLGPSDEPVVIPIHSDVLISGSLMFKTMLTGSYR